MEPEPPRPPLADPSDLNRPVSFRDLRRYRCENGIPWYRSAITITLFAVLGEAALLAASFLLRFIDLASHSWEARFLLLTVLPILYAALTCFTYCRWLLWRLRDVRLWRFAVSSGGFFFDLVETGPHGWDEALAGSGFPKNRRVIMRAVLGFRFDGMLLGRAQPEPHDSRGRISLRRFFAFARVSLPLACPHVIAQPRGSRILPLSGLGLNNCASLSLETKTGRPITVLCPKGFEDAARRLFIAAPVAALWSAFPSCEVEIIDDELYLYFPHSTPLWEAETMLRVLNLLALLAGSIGEGVLRRAPGADARNPPSPAGDGLGLHADAVPRSQRQFLNLSGRRVIDKEGVPTRTRLFLALLLILSAGLTVFMRFILPLIL